MLRSLVGERVFKTRTTLTTISFRERVSRLAVMVCLLNHDVGFVRIDNSLADVDELVVFGHLTVYVSISGSVVSYFGNNDGF